MQPLQPRILIVIDHQFMPEAETKVNAEFPEGSGYTVSYSHRVVAAAKRLESEKFGPGDAVIHELMTPFAENRHEQPPTETYLRQIANRRGVIYHSCRLSFMDITFKLVKDELPRITAAAP